MENRNRNVRAYISVHSNIHPEHNITNTLSRLRKHVAKRPYIQDTEKNRKRVLMHDEGDIMKTSSGMT